MVEQEPAATLGVPFSSEGAVATGWARGQSALEDAELYWLATVRPDGRPHVTPLLGIWLNGAVYFVTGADERKAKNLARNAHCSVTTGCNRLDGLDLVVEGDVAEVGNEAELGRIADAYERKYGPRFTAPNGTWFGLGDSIRQAAALVYKVAPTTVFGFAKGAVYSQTRWDFS